MQDLYTERRIAEDVFIAPNATVIGNIQLDAACSVWYGAVLRADNDRIQVGAGSNIQDNAVLHVDPHCPVQIGQRCVVGHGAIVHGATLGDHVLVGMNAVLLNHVEVGNYCIIGAGALLTGGMRIPDRSLVLGSPAKVVRTLTDEECRSIERNAEVYIDKAREFKKWYAEQA